MDTNIHQERQKKAKINIVISLLFQIITLLCGFIIPKMMIDAFGSEAYGATSSITQFLAYITLLEGGIGGVARAALYKPLARKNWFEVSSIVYEVKKFFRIIGSIFVVYVIILAFSFHSLAHIECFSWISTVLLVFAISISNFAQYFIGLPYIILVQAAQKTYVTNFISIITTILNALLTVVLILMGSNLIVVKLVSSLVFIIRPIFIYFYVRKHYPLSNKDLDRKTDYLPQKWSGLSQHIAYFLHSNTDIAVLTIFTNLKLVAVYSVYYMVVSHVQAICTSFSTGMEAMFGDMLARKEGDARINQTFSYYECLISVITIILFMTTAVMLIPFVRIYTRNVTDANYIQPVFGMLMILVSILYCTRSPYHNVIIAAGHFRQTQAAAYGEAIINIILSVLLVLKFGLTGIVTATVIGTSYRYIYYVIYLHNHIIHRPVQYFIKRLLVNMVNILAIFFCGQLFLHYFAVTGYFTWCVAGFVVVVEAGLFTLLFNFVFYRNETLKIIRKGFRKI